LAATEVGEDFPKITSLVSVLEYRITPEGRVNTANWGNEEIETRTGRVHLDQYLLDVRAEEKGLYLLIKTENQKTLRPDLIFKHFCPEVPFSVTRTGIFASSAIKISPLPAGLAILID